LRNAHGKSGGSSSTRAARLAHGARQSRAGGGHPRRLLRVADADEIDRVDRRARGDAAHDQAIQPHSDGRALYLKLPPLSQERRLQLAGQCKQHAEAAKIAIRNARRDANKILETEEKGGVLTEDDAKNAKEQVQELTKQYETKADEMVEKKKAEILQV
jgi:ribosome recycling factor